MAEYTPPRSGFDWTQFLGEAISDDVEAWQPGHGSDLAPDDAAEIYGRQIAGSLTVDRDGERFVIVVIRPEAVIETGEAEANGNEEKRHQVSG